MSDPFDPPEVRLIGFWVQRLSGPLSLCFPQNHAEGSYSMSDRQAIAEFLRRGERWCQERGYSWCRFGCGAPGETMGSGHWSQGGWAWPDGLAHYVEVHGVRVPVEVEQAALDKKPLENPSTFGLSWWKSWCRKRTPEAFLPRLESWREREAVEVERTMSEGEAEIRTRAAALEEKQGTGLTNCIKAGCPENALEGGVFCGWHCLTINGARDVQSECLRTELSVLREFLTVLTSDPSAPNE